MITKFFLPLVVLLAADVQAQPTAYFFQFTAAVPSCPKPLGPSGASRAPDVDAGIASELNTALSKGQLYTHSPLVNSSLWASVQDCIVTVEGCVAGDAYTSFDAGSIRTHIENIGNSIPNVRQTIVLVRTAAQAKEGLPLPYRVNPGPR